MNKEQELVAEYRKLKAEVEVAEEALSKKSKEFTSCKLSLIELLDSESKLRTAVYEGIGSISLTKPRVYASCNKENQATLFSYLAEVGRTDLIKETVNAQTLSSFVKENLEEGRAIPECISYILKTNVKFNPAK